MKYHEPGTAVTLRANGNSLVVEGEGSGIDENDLPYIFEPLYRGGSGAGGCGKRSNGAGLGLLISRDLVERMRGRISAEAREGGGTRVRIELPSAGKAHRTLRGALRVIAAWAVSVVWSSVSGS